MLLLMTVLERSADNDSLREYQREQWGSVNGETCVIELSGLAAHSFKIPRDRELFREERIKFIREKMLHCQPALVVMYGEREKPHWEAIAKQPFPAENILKIGSTIVAFTPHPTARGLTNAYWKQRGETLRQFALSPLTIVEPNRESRAIIDAGGRQKMKPENQGEQFVPRHRILLVSIGVTQGEIDTYDAARFAWRLDRTKADRAELVVAHVQGSVVGVYAPTKWMEANEKNFPKLKATHKNLRWGFEGVEADEATQKYYLGKRVPDQYPLTQNPVRYIPPEKWS